MKFKWESFQSTSGILKYGTNQGDGRSLLNCCHVLLNGVQACDSQLPQLDVSHFNMTQLLRQRRGLPAEVPASMMVSIGAAGVRAAAIDLVDAKYASN